MPVSSRSVCAFGAKADLHVRSGVRRMKWHRVSRFWPSGGMQPSDSEHFPKLFAGEMAEWLKAHAWKACLLERVTWVRIPLSPPVFYGLRIYHFWSKSA